MKVCVFVVNYKTDNHVLQCVRSIVASVERTHGIEVEVFVFDNSEKEQSEFERFQILVRENCDYARVICSDKNVGYFGCFQNAQSLSGGDCGCIIYCNPDIVFDTDFFGALNREYADSNAILAPKIIAGTDGFDQNPIYENRLSRQMLSALRLVYRNRLLLHLYAMVAFLKNMVRRHRYRERKGLPSSAVYAAHGSIFVFTNIDFFRSLDAFPCFLFLEELFVAEEARLANVSVLHAPGLIVSHERHVSIRSLATKAKIVYLAESLDFILKRYYS